MSNAAPQDRIDPNVSVPPAVRAAAARAEELLKKSIEKPTDPAPEVVENDNVGELKIQPAPVAPSGVEVSSVKPDDAPNWEHRYNSMKGRFEQESRARQAMQAQLTDLQRQLSELKSAAPPRQEVSFDKPKLLTAEEENDYGQDFLAVVGKKAKEEVSPELAALRAQIEELNGRLQNVDTTVAMTAREKLEAHLDNEVPNWRELNNNPDFVAWLGLPDIYSGGIRMELLHAAYYRNDAPRVAAFFKGFIADEAATNPAGAGAGRQVTSQGNPKKVPLETFAAPGRAKTTAASAPVEKPIFTRKQLADFYSAVQKGEFAGRDAEKEKIETAIFEAQREGRIR